MYWRAGKPERFVRPVRWIVGLLDHEVIPLEYAGVKASNRSRGHRILAAGEVTISAQMLTTKNWSTAKSSSIPPTG